MIAKKALGAKIKRINNSLLPVDKNRKGKCVSCGECCKLVFVCPFLKYKKGKSFCSIYKIRPTGCRKYPRSSKEFVTQKTCGFRFS
jgi:hypothetical protein